VICVLQRVASARVGVGDETVGEIGLGLVVLVGVVSADGQDDVRWMADKLANLRIFADQDERMNLSVTDVGGALLLVSQFTLAADTRRGRRPSFSRAAPPEQGEKIFDALATELGGNGLPVETGSFGAHMRVELVNDGPVTLILDSQDCR